MTGPSGVRRTSTSPSSIQQSQAASASPSTIERSQASVVTAEQDTLQPEPIADQRREVSPLFLPSPSPSPTQPLPPQGSGLSQEQVQHNVELAVLEAAVMRARAELDLQKAVLAGLEEKLKRKRGD